MSENTQAKTIGILKTPNDTRVCLLPKEVKRLTAELKYNILFESGLGDSLQIKDEEYEQAGATSAKRESIIEKSDTIVSINHTFSEVEIKENSKNKEHD